MEKLKSIVPTNLKRMVAESTPDDLPSTSSSLLEFFLQNQQFHQMIEDLVDNHLCGKNKETALDLKRKGNACFTTGDSAMASSFYSQALRVAPVDADDMKKNLVATLYLNRASSFHKMGLLLECLRDCKRALLISPNYAKVWYRRGKTNASLGNYEDAAHDLSVSMNLESSLSGKKQVESELLSILDKCNSTSNSLDQHSGKKAVTIDEQPQIKLQCVSTPTKGRGMTSADDIPSASLIHTEEPYAASTRPVPRDGTSTCNQTLQNSAESLKIISKHCRETHCHFCFNELPADTVSCMRCSIALYCSEHCKIQAGGQVLKNYPENSGICGVLSGELEQYVMQSTTAEDSNLDVEPNSEHKHECQGVNWPAILPTEIVLAGRILLKSMEQRRRSTDDSNFLEILELSHNYEQMLPEDKLELHVYSTVLLNCLHKSYGFELPINGASISQLVILIAQIKVNSMAIIRMKFIDVDGQLDQSGILALTGDALTSNAQQVRVGQAIYSAGSLFNHSCLPNIHVYFLKRTLFVRSTEFVAAGYPLELSYGPQVGQWDCKDRQQFLQDQYSFKCQCRGCSKLNLSDLVLNAFRCVDPNCLGVVLDNGVVKYEKEKVKNFHGVTRKCNSEPYLQVAKLRDNDIKKVAHHVFDKTNGSLHTRPEYCLNCGSFCDLVSTYTTVEEAGIYIGRLQDAIDSRKVPTTTLSDALRSLHMLRSTLHTYNRRIAEVGDNLAHAFCLVGEFQLATNHCTASIEILEKLYGPDHIVIGHELLKLSTIQLSMGDVTAVDSINRLSAIFLKYYGSHMGMALPYLQSLKREACKLVR